MIDYYNKWMAKWPSTAALSQATLDEVNQVWTGLGYYSRGRRLWESANIIEKEFNGVVPKTVAGLLKLPGVGRYTASAVASIAYGVGVGVVDGNVLRVFSRMRKIGAEIDSQIVTDFMWKLTDTVVDPARPGDFNQALMELGATVCVPKSPSCNKCPVKSVCHAYNQSGVPDIEDSCHLCINEKFDSDLGVMNYPRKSKKAASKEITTLVLALHKTVNDEKVLAVQQRPSKGLLANLWELLSFEVTVGSTEEHVQLVETYLQERKLLYKDLVWKGDVSHIFSHINMKYVVYSAESVEGDGGLEFVTTEEFLEKGTSTAMKKVVKCFEGKTEAKKRKIDAADPKQRSISSFFKPKV